MSNRLDAKARRRTLEQWRRSGLSAHRFAHRAKVSPWTLYKWRREFGAPGRFVEVVARGAAGGPPPEDAGREPVLEIALPAGILLRVGRDVDVDLLRRVVLALV